MDYDNSSLRYAGSSYGGDIWKGTDSEGNSVMVIYPSQTVGGASESDSDLIKKALTTISSGSGNQSGWSVSDALYYQSMLQKQQAENALRAKEEEARAMMSGPLADLARLQRMERESLMSNRYSPQYISYGSGGRAGVSSGASVAGANNLSSTRAVGSAYNPKFYEEVQNLFNQYSSSMYPKVSRKNVTAADIRKNIDASGLNALVSSANQYAPMFANAGYTPQQRQKMADYLRIFGENINKAVSSANQYARQLAEHQADVEYENARLNSQIEAAKATADFKLKLADLTNKYGAIGGIG